MFHSRSYPCSCSCRRDSEVLPSCESVLLASRSPLSLLFRLFFKLCSFASSSPPVLALALGLGLLLRYLLLSLSACLLAQTFSNSGSSLLACCSLWFLA